ncbi:hypothetical protein [Nocardia rhamnosiphila]|uniref:hypothetical protein n=1 Tax=Nocardia rhamnosiphila TaxID=426716 RepID=UPI000AF14BCF|nr:hypothetical protein [Nocardia rhamnosiphila]
MSKWGSDRRILPYGMRVEFDRRVFKPNSIDREPYVGNFNGNGADLLHVISSFIEALPQDKLIERDERHFGLPSTVRRQGRTICWQMEGGESGRASSIKLTKDSEKQFRERSGVEWEPYWVYAVVPSNSNQAWLLIEKNGRYTLPSEWRKELSQQFASAYHGYRLRLSTVREASLWSQIENALDDDRLVGFEVAFRSASIPSATTQAAGFERGMTKQTRETWATTGGPRSGRILRQFRRRYTGIQTPEGVRQIDAPLEVDDLSDPRYEIRLRDEIAEIKATVLTADGASRTIVFEGLDPQQSYVMDDTSLTRPSQDRFIRDCRTAVGDLARSGGVALPPGWHSGDWSHPETAISMEVEISDTPRQSSEPRQEDPAYV